MRGHDAFHTAVDEVPEGREFHRGERAAVGQDARQGEVGVEVGVAVAREMLRAGHDPGCAQALGPGESAFAHRHGVGAEGAVADDGVVGVAVDVHNGGEVHVHAEGPQFVPGHTTGLSNQVHVLDGAEGHGLRKANAVGQPHPGSPFCIHGGQEADAACGAGEAVEVVKVPGRVGLVPLHGNHTAHAEVHNQRGHIRGAFGLPRLGVERNHHELGDPRLHVEAVHPRQGGRRVAFEEGRARGKGRCKGRIGGRAAGTPECSAGAEGDRRP